MAPVTPYSDSDSAKKVQVEHMFDQIASRYDLLNQLLSFGLHHYWRKKTIQLIRQQVGHKNPKSILDVATGTGDFAIASLVLNPVDVTGIDLSDHMLAIGKEKIKNKKLNESIKMIKADSEALPFSENKFDLALVGFGVRNFENLRKGLTEIKRVLTPGGRLAILEFSMPEQFPFKQLYHFYLSLICPLIGRLISGNNVAYNYLFRSIKDFPYGERMSLILKEAGFSSVTYSALTFGIVTVYIAEK